MQNLTQNLTKKEMDRAIVVFQARLKSEYKLFVKTKDMVTYTGSECSHDVMQYMPICSHVAIEAVVLYIIQKFNGKTFL